MGDVIPFRPRRKKMTEDQKQDLIKSLWPLRYATSGPITLNSFKPLSPEDAQEKIDAFFKAFPATLKGMKE